MKTATLSQLRSRPGLLREGKAVLVTERGRTLGFFQPLPDPDDTIPLEARRKLYRKTSARIAGQMDRRGVTEEQLQRDFEALRRARRRQ